MAKRFITPFAEAGDRAEISNEPIGSDVNMQTGYPAEYEADPVSDPNARFVERDKTNQLYNDITANIKEWQENTYPAFITAANNGGTAFSYKKGDRVSYNGDNYESLEDANEDIPTTSKWVISRPTDVIKAMLIAQGLSGSYGFFDKGFSYVSVGDVGIGVDGKIYTYVGAAALPVAVTAGTNPVGSGDYRRFIITQSFNRVLFGDKFSFGTAASGAYMTLQNEIGNKTIVRFADGTNGSDAHLFLLPLEVRGNGHSLISSVGTDEAMNDLLFRTFRLSDQYYISSNTKRGQEALIFSHDTLPARSDGSRKQGTGGFGLTPEQDKYSFDNSITLPTNVAGNRYDYKQHIQFPSLYATFEQGVGVKRRSTGNFGYQWNYGSSTNNTYIECLENKNTLVEFTPDSTIIGGVSNINIDFDTETSPLVGGYVSGTGFNVRTQFSKYMPSVSSSAPLKIKLVKSGVQKLVGVRVSVFTSPANTGYSIVNAYWNGSTHSIIGTPEESLPSGVTVSLSTDADGDLLFEVLYTSSGLRASVSIDIN